MAPASQQPHFPDRHIGDQQQQAASAAARRGASGKAKRLRAQRGQEKLTGLPTASRPPTPWRRKRTKARRRLRGAHWGIRHAVSLKNGGVCTLPLAVPAKLELAQGRLVVEQEQCVLGRVRRRAAPPSLANGVHAVHVPVLLLRRTARRRTVVMHDVVGSGAPDNYQRSLPCPLFRTIPGRRRAGLGCRSWG